MRTVGRDSIVEWKTHLQRISNSVSKLSAEGNEDKVKNAMVAFSEVTALETKLIPMLKKGFQTYYDEVDNSNGTSHPFETKVSLMVTYSNEVCFSTSCDSSQCANFTCRRRSLCLLLILLNYPLFLRKRE